MHTEFNNIDVALERFRAAAKLLPKSVIPKYMRISALTQARRFKDIPRIFKVIFREFPESGFAHYQFAMLKGRVPIEIEQRTHLELALDFDPQLTVAHMALAEALLRESPTASSKAPLLEKALNHCMEALKLQDGGTRASLLQTAHVHYAITRLRRAEVLEEENPTEQAAKRALAQESAKSTRKFLQEVQNKYPSFVPAIITRVRFEMAEMQFAAAADLASSFMQNQQSDDAKLRFLFIDALIKQGTHDRRPAKLLLAKTELERLININPLDMTAYAGLVNLYDAMERPNLAAATLARMWLHDRNNMQIAFKLAVAYLKINQPANAMAVYDEIAEALKSATNRKATTIRHLAIVGSARSLTLIPTPSEADRIANINKAIATLSPLTSISPSGKPNIAAMLLQGDLLQKLRKFPEALRLYEGAEALDPKSYEPLRALAIFHYRQRDYGKVIALLQDKIIPQRKNDPFEHSRLALALIARNAPGDLKEAQAAAARARDLMSRTYRQPGLPEGATELYENTTVLAHIVGKKYHDARTTVTKGLPERMERTAYTRLIDFCAQNATRRREFIAPFANYIFLSSLGETEEAVTHLKKLLARFPGNYSLLSQLGALYKRNNEVAKVADVLEQRIAAAEAPTSVITRPALRKLYSGLISTYIIRLAPHTRSAVEKADAICEQALRKWPRNVEFLELHSKVRSLQGDDPKLIAALNLVIAAAKEGTTEWVEAHKQLALAYSRMKQHDKSFAICDRIQEYTQSDAIWQNNWAWLLAKAPTPDLDKAITHATQAKTLNPTNPDIRDTLGWILHLAGKYRQAHVELNYAALQRPRDPNLTYRLGANYVKLRKYKEALEALEKAITISRQGRGVPLADKDACQKLIAETKARLDAASP